MRKLNEIELELTSKCNAACPACKRTQLNIKGRLEINDIVLTDLQKGFYLPPLKIPKINPIKSVRTS